MAPMIGLIIAIIYGLSTDYEVFLLSRMVEASERGLSPPRPSGWALPHRPVDHRRRSDPGGGYRWFASPTS